MAIVDITGKDVVFRRSTAVSIIENIKRLSIERILTVTEVAARQAWLFLPHLHPVNIEKVSLAISKNGNSVEISATCCTHYKTGVEMDALFAVCAASTEAVYENLDLLCSCDVRIREIKVSEKVKQKDGEISLNDYLNVNIKDIEHHNISHGQSVRSSQSISGICEGKIRLSSKSVELIKLKRLEKGDAIEIAKATALLALKKAWLLIPGLPVPRIEKARVTMEVNEDSVLARVEAYLAVGVGVELLFATLICLICVWDIVKKYEKDSQGQYPWTYIHDVILTIK